MPLISPPDDTPFEPEPEPERETNAQEEYWRYRKIKLYMECQNWKCPACGCVVFGRCITCPCCRHKYHRITERPKDWKAHAE